jgi:5,10-methylenetetrahydromethanopterin reductase
VTPPRLGAVFRPQRPPEELPDFARTVERLGFDELWVVEDCFEAGGPTAATVALAATRTLQVGIGLLPAAVRNPAIAAMELATIARAFPGRLRVAFGHGVEAWMRQVAARPPDRLVALEETVAAVRALLAGRRVSVDGRHVRLDAVQLAHVPEPAPPVVIGTTGPAGLAIARRAADGVLLPEGSGPAAVREASAAGETTAYAWLSVDDDATGALAALRPAVSDDWARFYPRLAEHAGAAAGERLDDATLASLAVAGDAATCARAVDALARAGAASVAFIARAGEDEAQLERFAADVRPRLGDPSP